MSSFPEALKRLRKDKGLTQAQLAEALGVGKSTISMYEVGAREPSFEMLDILAGFFKVELIELMQPDESLTVGDRHDIARDLERIMASMEHNGDLMFDGDPLGDDARASILSAVQLGLQAAKAKNKERFTPKKYRKE